MPGPWQIVWTQECQSRAEAMKLEKKIKSRGIGRFLKDVNRQSPAVGGINH